jgi:hypothetical protein
VRPERSAAGYRPRSKRHDNAIGAAVAIIASQGDLRAHSNAAFFLFLAVGAPPLFSFIAVATWASERPEQRRLPCWRHSFARGHDAVRLFLLQP